MGESFQVRTPESFFPYAGTIRVRSRRKTIFAIERTNRHGHPFLALRGELDIQVASELLGAGRRELAGAPDDRRLVIDLSDLAFMDSSGLQALWILRSEARTAGWELELVRGGADVHRVFQLTGLDSSFAFVDEAAV